MKEKLNVSLLLKVLGIFIFGFCLGIGIVFPGGSSGKKPDGKLTIAFINDTHNHLFPFQDRYNGRIYGGAARWATILKNIRNEAGEILFLHGGDMVTSSDPAYTLNGRPDWERLPGFGYRGFLEVLVFDKLGLDAMSIGNHEFDYGLFWNYRLFSKASFDALAANVVVRLVPDSSSYDPPHIMPYKIYRKGNFRIGIIGYVTTTNAIRTPQIKINDPAESASSLVKQLKKECDIVMVLSHLGADEDVELASRVPGIDIIIGGHSHTMLSEPRIINGTIITQARAFGEFVGRLDVEYQKGSLKNYQYKLIPADFSVSEDPEMKTWLDQYLFPITLKSDFSPDGVGEASLGSFIAEAIEKKNPCDAVVVKTGGYPKGLLKGDVSAEDFFSSLWPYSRREDGPEKELSPEQVMDIVSGRAPSAARFLLNSTAGLMTLIAADVPDSVLYEIETLCWETFGTRDALFCKRFNLISPGNTSRLIMDLPSWIDLYREGILSEKYKYENLKNEIFEILLSDLR